jgi:3-phenylpropionate/trans-cinnamate dioxygenase ferredoxin subunit
MITEFVPTIPEVELEEGNMRGVTVSDVPVLLAKVGGEIFAINDICSHFHTHLSQGELLADRVEVQCPLHDSCFSLRTGEPTDEPAEDPVETYAVKVEGGTIYVGPNAPT